MPNVSQPNQSGPIIQNNAQQGGSPGNSPPIQQAWIWCSAIHSFLLIAKIIINL